MLVWLVSLIGMHSMYKLVWRFRLHSIGKNFSSVSRNMDSVTWDMLKQVVVRSREVDMNSNYFCENREYSYCIKFVLSYLGTKIIKNIRLHRTTMYLADLLTVA